MGYKNLGTKQPNRVRARLGLGLHGALVTDIVQRRAFALLLGPIRQRWACLSGWDLLSREVLPNWVGLRALVSSLQESPPEATPCVR